MNEIKYSKILEHLTLNDVKDILMNGGIKPKQDRHKVYDQLKYMTMKSRRVLIIMSNYDYYDYGMIKKMLFHGYSMDTIENTIASATNYSKSI